MKSSPSLARRLLSILPQEEPRPGYMQAQPARQPGTTCTAHDSWHVPWSPCTLQIEALADLPDNLMGTSGDPLGALAMGGDQSHSGSDTRLPRQRGWQQFGWHGDDETGVSDALLYQLAALDVGPPPALTGRSSAAHPAWLLIASNLHAGGCFGRPAQLLPPVPLQAMQGPAAQQVPGWLAAAASVLAPVQVCSAPWLACRRH